MKKLLLKSMLLLCALVVGSMNGWADSYTITFSTGTGDGSSVSTSTACSSIVSAGASYLTGNLVTATRAYSGGSGGLKLGASSDAGEIKMNLASAVTPTSIVISAKRYNTSKSVSLSLNGSTAQTVSNSTDFNNYTFNITSNTTYLQINASKYCWISSITVNTASGKSPAGLSYSTAKYATTYGSSFATPTLTNPHDLTVSYASSDETIATVDGSSGAVTILNKTGITTITASFAGDASYEAGTASYKIFVSEHNGTSASPFTVAEATSFITNTLYDGETHYYVSGIVSQTSNNISSGKNSYYISDDGSKTNQLQVYQGKDLENADFTVSTLVKVGENVVVRGPLLYYNSSKAEINDGNYLYSITRKTAANLTVHANISNLEVTQEVSDLYTTDSDGDVTITSSNEEVANIVGNKLVGLKAGNATITVKVAFNSTYSGEEKSFNVTVTVKDPVAPAGLSDVGFKKVTTEGDVASGEYLIVYEGGNVVFDGSLNTLDVGNNYIGVTISNNTIPALETLKAATFTYDASNHTLVSKSGKYIGNSSYANGLTQADAATLTNSLSIDGGNVVITALNSEGTGDDEGKYTTLRFNSTNAPYRFRYYKSGQQAIQLYKLSSTTTYDITIGSTGYKTLISAASATLPSGLTAYKAVSAGAGKINLISVASIKAGSAYILKGTASTGYTLTVTNSPEEPTGNILEVSTESSGNGCYVLADGTNGVGFYKWTGGSLGAGRAIVPASAVSTAREFLEFSFGDEDITSVNELKVQKADNQYFNLAGQRVAQPTKGLYIVNGKKVIIK